MGIYLHPAVHSPIFKKCYNGEAALDNVCMHPSGVLEGMGNDDGHTAKPGYRSWLLRGSPPPENVHGELVAQPMGTTVRSACTRTPSSKPQPLGYSSSGEEYLKSVPTKNRHPFRWGWKNPKTIFHLQKLWSVYPDLLFVHVLRNPLDMASVPFQHLRNRAREFSGLLGGEGAASRTLDSRCRSMEQRQLFSDSGGPGSVQLDCLISAPVLKGVSECKQKDDRGLERCARDAGYPRRGHAGWSCLHAMLWADINTAVGAFGMRCLRPLGRYVRWHAEDVYALRGPTAQAALQSTLSSALGVPLPTVAAAFESPDSSSSSSSSSPPSAPPLLSLHEPGAPPKEPSPRVARRTRSLLAAATKRLFGRRRKGDSHLLSTLGFRESSPPPQQRRRRQGQGIALRERRQRRSKRRSGGRRRRLGYGKYLSLEEAQGFNSTRAVACAEEAVPGALEALDYPPALITDAGLLLQQQGAPSDWAGPAPRLFYAPGAAAVANQVVADAAVETPASPPQRAIEPAPPRGGGGGGGGWDDALGPLLVTALALAVIVWNRRVRARTAAATAPLPPSEEGDFDFAGAGQCPDER